MSDPPHWREQQREAIADCKVFRVSRSMSTSPHTGNTHPFYRIDAEDWCNIVPLTRSGELVMIRQYRHGADEVTLEVPGGIVDPGESPALAAARELREETGYAAVLPVEVIGTVNPNPALFGNRVHSFVAPEVEWAGEIQNGATEETAVELVPRADLDARLRAGHIDHALVVAALQWFALWEARR